MRITIYGIGLVVCALACVASETVHAVDERLAVLAAYTRADGKIDYAALEKDWAKYRAARASGPLAQSSAPAKAAPRTSPAYLPPSAQSAHAEASSTSRSAATKSPPLQSAAFILRQDFSDIYLFTNPTPNADAAGAEFSWTRNRVTEDTTWTANFTAALAYSYLETNPDSRLIGFSVAPYVQATRELHSNPAFDDTDQVTVGGTAEIGIAKLFGSGQFSDDYFRIRGAVTSDRVLDRQISQVTGEWIPVWLSRAGGIKPLHLVYNFLPEAKVQYASTSDATKPLAFSGEREALRVGPEATLLFRIYDPFLPKEWQWLQRFSGKVTYHWWTELNSGRDGSWLNTSLIYNLDEAGDIAISASYKKGTNEETGAKTDLFKIAFTAKMCAALIGDKCAAVQDQPLPKR